MNRLHASALMIVVSFAVVSLALAAKPGGGNTGGGTIYFMSGSGASFGMSTMNSDGTGKTALPLDVRGTPSRILHGGHRWFLRTRTIPGEFYPNGSGRHEVFAFRDDGNEDFTVQLTDDPDLQFLTSIWAPGETANVGLFSGFARRWVFDGVDWVIDPDSVGIYTAIVLFDGQGDVAGLAADPAPLVSVGVVADNNTPGVWWPAAYNWQFDWSPDLTEIVYSNSTRSALLAHDVITDEVRTLTTDNSPYGAKWSPAGNRIVFGTGYGDIDRTGWHGPQRSHSRGGELRVLVSGHLAHRQPYRLYAPSPWRFGERSVSRDRQWRDQGQPHQRYSRLGEFRRLALAPQRKRPGRSRRQADLSPALEPHRAHGLRAWGTAFLLYRRPP